MDRIDLHTHSRYSDGSLSPRHLVQLARQEGLRAVALTDHDTVAGVEEAIAAGKDLNVEVVPGVELSAQYIPGTMHILGYYIAPTNPQLVHALEVLQQARAVRTPKIIAQLESLGLTVTRGEVTGLSGGLVGRRHIAQALVQRGYVSSIDEAFERYLKKGGPAYVERFRFSPRKAIDMIRGAGGLAVLAHPFTLRIEQREELTRLLGELQAMGLEGIEVFYPEHTEEMSAHYRQIARRLGLLCTGGSDFHGNLKDGLHSWSGRNAGPPGYSVLKDLRGRLLRRESSD